MWRKPKKVPCWDFTGGQECPERLRCQGDFHKTGVGGKRGRERAVGGKEEKKGEKGREMRDRGRE